MTRVPTGPPAEPTQPSVPARTAVRPLSYAGPQPGRPHLGDPIERHVGSRGREFWLPVGVIAVGTILYLWRAIMLFGVGPEALVGALTQMATNVIVLTVSLLVVSRVVDISLGMLGGVALKLVATALLPNAVGGMLVVTGGASGIASAALVSFFLYWLLFVVLFELSPYEAAFCVVVAWTLGVISWLFVHEMLFQLF